MAENKGILICGEIAKGSIAAITQELLAAGRKLADALGEEAITLLMGSGIEGLGKEAIAFGADKVYIADHPLLAQYHPDCYTAVATKVCQQLNSSIVLLGQTDMGRDLTPRLAARLGGGLCMDCLELDIDPETKLMLQTRPVYGGNARAIKVCEKARPQIATIRSKAVSPLERDDSRQGEVIKFDADIDESVMKVKVVDRVKEEAAGVKLEEAEVIVTGGRGIGGPEGFETLRELAKLLGGAVGGTRVACEEGWLPTSLQVGQTGKVVGPTLYIAVAVSGAMQHLAGCSGSRNIVAINKDPEANIFKVARFGVVADYQVAVPALIAKCKELLAT